MPRRLAALLVALGLAAPIAAAPAGPAFPERDDPQGRSVPEAPDPDGTEGQPEHDEDAAADLAGRLARIERVSGRFEQRVFDGEGRLVQASRGEFSAAAPRRFRWRTEGPFPSLLLSDGQDLWLYDEDLRQVVVRDLDPRLGHTPMLLLSGDAAEVGARYRVVRPAPDVFELRPRDEDAPFRALRLVFAPEGSGARLERLVITDALDQSTRIAFESLRLDATLPDDAFEFEVPEGVELVDERDA